MFDKVKNLFETLNVPYEVVNFRVNAGGITTLEKVYIGNPQWYHTEEYMMFVALHEIGHYKRLQSGKVPDMELVVKEPFEKFFEIVLKEEKIAERYSQYCYRKIYGKLPEKSPLENRPEGVERLYREAYNTFHSFNGTYLEFIHSLIDKN